MMGNRLAENRVTLLSFSLFREPGTNKYGDGPKQRIAGPQPVIRVRKSRIDLLPRLAAS
jgi:hypothetical protein